MNFPLPNVGLPAAFAPFAVVAFAMVGITIFVLGKVLPADHRAPMISQMLLALSVLGGGMVLLVSLVSVYFDPDGTSAWTWVLLAFNFMMMAPAGIWFISHILFRDRCIDPRGWFWPVAIGLVTTGTEILMGFLFALGTPSVTPTAVNALAAGLAGVWFFWSMSAVMVALVVWAPLSRVERMSLGALTTATALAPWVTAYPIVGGVAMTVLMLTVFLLIVRYLLTRAVRASELSLLFGLAGAFLATAFAGLYLATDGGRLASLIVFGSVMAVVMVLEISYLVQRFYSGPTDRPWVARPTEAPVAAPRSAGGPAAEASPAEALPATH